MFVEVDATKAALGQSKNGRVPGACLSLARLYSLLNNIEGSGAGLNVDSLDESLYF